MTACRAPLRAGRAFWLGLCEICHDGLPHSPSADEPEPLWHQVVELPEIPVHVTEYQAHARTCPSCGHLNWTKIPASARERVCGPRLTATLSFMSAVLHASKRGIEDFADTVLLVPIGQILFREWYLFRCGGSRAALKRELEPLREAMWSWLEDAATIPRPKPCVATCSPSSQPGGR